MAEPSGPGSNLPAPYQAPWVRLVADLRDLLASLQLKVWEFWRRNAQGDFWRPAFWPIALAPLFWPLLLGLGLALPVLVVRALPHGSGNPEPRNVSIAPPVAAEPPPMVPSPMPAGKATVDTATVNPGTVNAELDLATSPTPLPPPETRPRSEAPAQPPPLQPPLPPPLPPPLLNDFNDLDPDALLQGAQGDPSRLVLRLEVSPPFRALRPSSRLELLNRWQQRAEDLGFERLELRDLGGREIARSALVGSGMILLDSLPSP
jgi:hypothetical protein